MKAAKESCKHRLWFLASHSPPRTPSWLEGQDYLLIWNELPSIRLHSIFLAHFYNSWENASISFPVEAFFIFMEWVFLVFFDEKVPAHSQRAVLTSCWRRNRSRFHGHKRKINKNIHWDFYTFCPCCPAQSWALAELCSQGIHGVPLSHWISWGWKWSWSSAPTLGTALFTHFHRTWRNAKDFRSLSWIIFQILSS